MKVYIDTREPPKIKKMAAEIFEDIELLALEFGDIYVKELDLCIERKDISDFISSFKSGHIQKQLINMNKYHNSILIVSGSYKDLFFKNHKTQITVNQYLGMLRHIGMKYRVKMFQVENDNQLMTLTKSIIDSLQRNEVFEFFGESKHIQKELPPIVKTLMLVNGISIKIANLIYSNHKSLKTIKDLCLSKGLSIKGIGNKKQEAIYNFLKEL
jgi:ERCC4-type nuclease